MLNRLRDLLIDGLLLALMLLLGIVARSPPGRRVAEFLDGVVLSKIPGYLIATTVAASFSTSERGRA